jgi:20S proteasome alpha/beta subunit
MFLIFILLIITTHFVKASVVVVIQCTDGILIGTDSISSIGSMSSKQSLVQNRFSKTIFPIDKHTCLCYVAGSSDFFNLYDDVLRFAMTFQSDSISDSSHTPTIPAASIASYVRHLISARYPKVHTLVLGVSEDSAHIFEILPGGSNIQQTLACCGSGADNALAAAQLLFEDGKTNVADGVGMLKRVLKSTLGGDSRTKGRTCISSLTLAGITDL